MKELHEIALYLIYKDVTTSQSIGKWLQQLREKWSKDSEFVNSGRFHEFVRQYSEMGVISPSVAEYLLQYTLWQDEASHLLEELALLGIQSIIIGDSLYPIQFKEIYDSPGVFYYCGNIDLLKERNFVTMVGTREPTNYAVIKAKQLTYEAVNCDVVVVSGKAAGIDSIVYDEILCRGGKTVAVVPQLTDEIRSEVLMHRDNILYLSEFPPLKKGISKWQFVARNRLLAALSLYTVVVEAPIRSGTLITADFALMYGKSVFVVLPAPMSEQSYGGIQLAQAIGVGMYIQSLYDIFYTEEENDLIEKYLAFVRKLSKDKIAFKPNDARHLMSINLKHEILASCDNKLDTFDRTMVELQQFGIIRERKGKVIFNFAGYESWPKI